MLQAKRYFSSSVKIRYIQNAFNKNWKFGRWILGGSTANWISAEVYPLLAAGIINFAAAGAYRALQNLVAPVHVLLKAIDTFITPLASKKYQSGGRHSANKILIIVYAIIGLPIAGYLILVYYYAGPLLQLLYRNRYASYEKGIILMILFYTFWFIYWPLQAIFKATRQAQPVFYANITAIISMFSIGLFCIYRWGIYGAITGQVLNAIIIGLILWFTWLRDKPISRQ